MTFSRAATTSLLAASLGASLLLDAAPTFAQRGDREGADMVEVWRQMEVPEAPPLSPQEGLQSLSVAPGFRVELVAAEPLVEDPIAIRWDARGRMYVVEMRGFMPNVDGTGEQEPVGRIVVLEDKDQDGVMDSSTVFLDELVLARAIAVVEGGLLIGEPPRLWFCPDADDDLRCDRKIEVAEYGDDHPDALEHTENGLVWAVDNWIYNAKSDRRFRWRKGKISEEKTHFRGQWGISQDDWGRLYYNTNSRYLYVDLIPAEPLLLNPHYRPGAGGQGVNQRVVLDESVFSIRVNPGINRGYEKAMLRDDGRLKVTTSVSGVCVYRGDQYPTSMRGNVFIPEPAGNVVTLHHLQDKGLGMTAEHATFPDETWGERDFLASSDERFRPVDCSIGPDGAMYVVDMYRGILQHQKFVTTFLRKQILERKLDVPIGLGRIYRVVWQGDASPAPPLRRSPPALETEAELLAALEHANGWVRDTAQQRIVERANASKKMLTGLEELVASDAPAHVRTQALWTLEGLHSLRRDTVVAALEVRPGADNSHTRAAALRAGGALLEVADLARLLDIKGHGNQGHPDQGRTTKTVPRVRVLAAQALAGHDSAEARTLLTELLFSEPADDYLRQAALAGIGGAETRVFQNWIEYSSKLDEKSRQDHVGLARELAELFIGAAPRPRATPDFEAALRSLAGLPADLQVAVLDGFVEAAESADTEPILLSAAFMPPKPALEKPAQATDDQEARAKIARILTTADAVPAAAGIDRDPAVMATGRKLYSACESCHGEDGAGLEGTAPSLVDANYVEGAAGDLARIVLLGLEGPLESGGETWDDIMPGFARDRRFTDDGIAALLTFLRGSWGNDAEPVSKEDVARVRSELADRTRSISTEELNQLP